MLADNNEETFIQSFILVIFCVFLCPNSSLNVNTQYLYALSDVELIPKMDWCGHVLQFLMDGIQSYNNFSKAWCGYENEKSQKNVHVHGCVFLLAVIYTDFVDLGTSRPPTGFPRIGFVAWEHFTKLLEQDKRKTSLNLGYGQLRVLAFCKTPYCVASEEHAMNAPTAQGEMPIRSARGQAYDVPSNMPSRQEEASDPTLKDGLPSSSSSASTSEVPSDVRAVFEKYLDLMRSSRRKIFDEFVERLEKSDLALSEELFTELSVVLKTSESAASS